MRSYLNVNTLYTLICLDAILSKCKSLVHVEMSGCKRLVHVDMSGCKRLVHVEMSGCKHLVHVDMSGCKHLVHVDMSGCDLIKMQMPCTRGYVWMRSYQNVNALYTWICLDAILSTCKRLVHMEMSGCKRLVHVDMSGCDLIKM